MNLSRNAKKLSTTAESNLNFKWKLEFTASGFYYILTLDPKVHKFLVDENAVREDCYKCMSELNRHIEGPIMVKKEYLH